MSLLTKWNYSWKCTRRTEKRENWSNLERVRRREVWFFFIHLWKSNEEMHRKKNFFIAKFGEQTASRLSFDSFGTNHLPLQKWENLAKLARKDLQYWKGKSSFHTFFVLQNGVGRKIGLEMMRAFAFAAKVQSLWNQSQKR